MVRHILNALWHIQQPTPVKTDNSFALSFVHDLLIQTNTNH